MRKISAFTEWVIIALFMVAVCKMAATQETPQAQQQAQQDETVRVILILPPADDPFWERDKSKGEFCYPFEVQFGCYEFWGGYNKPPQTIVGRL